HHAGAGQRPLSTQRRGAGVGGSVRHHAVVPAVVLSQPEPHRTTLEVHEASRPIRSLPPDFPGLSSRHPRGSRRFVNQVLPATGLVDDAEFPAIRRRLTHGRVRYNPFLPSAQQLLLWGANDGARVVLRHEAWRLPASVFIHGGVLHLQSTCGVSSTSDRWSNDASAMSPPRYSTAQPGSAARSPAWRHCRCGAAWGPRGRFSGCSEPCWHSCSSTTVRFPPRCSDPCDRVL